MTLFFLCFHPLTLFILYEMWANLHPLLLLHSASLILLALFVWALPDPKFESWLRERLWLYYTLALLNTLATVLGLGVGGYFYFTGPALYSYMAVAGITYVLVVEGPMMVVIGISFAMVQVKYNGKP